MKASTLLVAASLVVNVALVAVFFADSSATRVSSSTAALSTKSSATTGGKAATTVDPQAWVHLETKDLPAFLAHLRAEGFPPAVIRAIMTDQIRAQFAPRRNALNVKGERPFWEPANNQDPKTVMALREIEKEQDQALKDLLGPDTSNDELFAATLRRQLPGLSDDKITQLQRIQQEFAEKRNDLSLSQGGIMPPDYQEKRLALEKAQHAEIAQTLTPKELEEYDLRTSTTASSLRSQLTAFDATEQEFRTLFAIKQAYDDRLGPLYIGANGPPSQEDLRARSDAQKQQNDDIKAALGDERYADYQRANDSSYRQTSQLVSRLQLPPETTNQIYAVQQDIQQRLREVQTNRSLAVDDRNQQLAILADEAKARVTATLGERGFEAYQQYGGSWLQTLQPRPAPVPPTGTAPTGGNSTIYLR